jgi:WD40 repeat protein
MITALKLCFQFQLAPLQHGHCASVLSLTFSADGSTLVSGGEDNCIMLWKVDARK